MPLSKRRFEVFGPYPLETGTPFDHLEALSQFWQDREGEDTSELSTAVGVYVWTFKEGSRRIPWNVGITSKQGFKARFTQKGFGFLKFLSRQPGAKIEVYLLARRTKTGKFSKTRQKGLNEWLETMLIGSSLSVNADLQNKAKSKFLRTTIVDGYLGNSEDPSDAAKSFRKLFKAQARKRT